jgi:hypothetical protein
MAVLQLRVSHAQVDIGKTHIASYNHNFERIKKVPIIYHDTLKADLYYPLKHRKKGLLPCVILVSGFDKFNFRKGQSYIDWCRQLALKGVLGVVYETREPSRDFDALLAFLIRESLSLGIDTARIGTWSCSANSLLAINKANEHESIRCQVIYYGLTVTSASTRLAEVKRMCDDHGIAYFISGNYTSSKPTFIVRAGKDSWDLIQDSIREFIFQLFKVNAYLEVVNYENGQHSFDALDHSELSKNIIGRTIDFYLASM